MEHDFKEGEIVVMKIDLNKQYIFLKTRPDGIYAICIELRSQEQHDILLIALRRPPKSSWINPYGD